MVHFQKIVGRVFGGQRYHEFIMEINLVEHKGGAISKTS